jgi:hypothetical protein
VNEDDKFSGDKFSRDKFSGHIFSPRMNFPQGANFPWRNFPIEMYFPITGENVTLIKIRFLSKMNLRD